jgi:hypothetical protein
MHLPRVCYVPAAAPNKSATSQLRRIDLLVLRRASRIEQKQSRRHEALQAAQVFHSEALRREHMQQQIASNASKLLEAPEEQLPCLRALLELTLDSDLVVCLPCVRRPHP